MSRAICRPGVPWEGAAYLVRELARSDWRLQVATSIVAALAREYGFRAILTCVERDPIETRRIYVAAGKEPPSTSVHDVRPCRGGDMMPDAYPTEPVSAPPRGIGELVASRANELMVYPGRYSTVLWHDVAGPHWHVQVPWGEGWHLCPPPPGEIL